MNNEDVCNVEQEKRLQEGVYPKHYYCINFLILLYQIIFTTCTRYPGRIYFILLYLKIYHGTNDLLNIHNVVYMYLFII